MRATKVAIAAALAADDAISELVPAAQVFAVERATLPTLPAVEVIAVSSERVDTGPLALHSLSVECTVSHPTEDGADKLLDDIVRAVRARLSASEDSTRRIALATGEGCLCVLAGTRWSVVCGQCVGHRTGRGGRSQRRGQRIEDPYAHAMA